MMKRILPPIFAFAAAFAFGVSAQADDKVTLEQTPEKVQETIRNWVENGKLGEIARQVQQDQPVTYRVDFMGQDGTAFEIEVAEDGSVLRERGRLN